MYWRDIDTIAPRRPVRARRNYRTRQPEPVSPRVYEPDVAKSTIVDDLLVEEESVSPREETVSSKKEVTAGHESNWQEKAQRLQAEMDNFRKRQERRADEAISSERERLLTLFLPAVDNLARALAHEDDVHQDGTHQDDAHQDEGIESVRLGVELTHRELMRVLAAEGVTPLETIGQPFDPMWHEALATLPAEVEPGTVVEQVEAGYRLDDKLLRPAKVVVAA